MNFFDITGILVGLAALFAFINHKLLKLPTTVCNPPAVRTFKSKAVWGSWV